MYFGLIKAYDPAGNAQGSRCWENSLCYRDALTRHLSYIYRATARDGLRSRNLVRNVVCVSPVQFCTEISALMLVSRVS